MHFCSLDSAPMFAIYFEFLFLFAFVVWFLSRRSELLLRLVNANDQLKFSICWCGLSPSRGTTEPFRNVHEHSPGLLKNVFHGNQLLLISPQRIGVKLVFEVGEWNMPSWHPMPQLKSKSLIWYSKKKGRRLIASNPILSWVVRREYHIHSPIKIGHNALRSHVPCRPLFARTLLWHWPASVNQK